MCQFSVPIYSFGKYEKDIQYELKLMLEFTHLGQENMHH